MGVTRGRRVRRVCQCCGATFAVRQADLDRGWGNACRKSCAARLRERERAQVPMPRHVPGLDPAPGPDAPPLDTTGPEFAFQEDPSDGRP